MRKLLIRIGLAAGFLIMPEPMELLCLVLGLRRTARYVRKLWNEDRVQRRPGNWVDDDG